MASKPTFQVTLPTTGFKHLMFFNRFAVDHDEEFVFIHFGHVNKLNAQADAYSVAIAKIEVSNLRKSSMEFLGKQGSLGLEPPLWQPISEKRVELVNHINFARHGGIAETVLSSFSFWGVMAEQKKSKPSSSFLAEAVALLRSPLSVQQHLIRSLFETEPDDKLLTKT